MKKVVDIKAVSLDEITKHLEEGWELYGYPIMSGGLNPYLYQCMVKYTDEEIEGKIVEVIKVEAYINEVITSGCPDISSKAKQYIESGYQPYGTVMINRIDNHGLFTAYAYLAMAKYK